MGTFLARIKSVFQTRANQAVDALEDPRASLEYSLTRLEANRRDLVRSLIDVSASRQNMASQHTRLVEYLGKYQEQAQLAVNAGNDDLARLTLERKYEVDNHREELEKNMSNLDQQIEVLKESLASLERKIALFRYKKEELKSVYDSARAQLRVREALSGVSSDIADVGSTIQRIEERIMTMRARADAINNLIGQGVLADVLESNGADRQLNSLYRSQAVEDELARLKGGNTQDRITIVNPAAQIPAPDTRNETVQEPAEPPDNPPS